MPGEDWSDQVEEDPVPTAFIPTKWTPAACTRKVDQWLHPSRDADRTPQEHSPNDVQRAKTERIALDQARIKHRTRHRLNHPNEQAVAEAGSSAQMQRFARKYAVENAVNRKEG